MGAIVSVIFNGFTLVIGFLRKFFPFINKFIGFIGGFLTSKLARVALLGTMGATVIAALMACVYMSINGLLDFYNFLNTFFSSISDISKIDSSPVVFCVMHYLNAFGIIPAVNNFLPTLTALLMWFITDLLCRIAWRAYYYIYDIVSKYA